MRNQISRLLLSGTLLIGLCAGSASAQSTEYSIAGVYYYGCDDSFVDDIRKAMPLHAGEKRTRDEMLSIKSQVTNAVWQQIRCAPTEVASVHCGNNVYNIYIGLPGRSVVNMVYDPAPTGQAQLPKEGKTLYDDKIHTLQTVLASKDGGGGEDDSKGYSLATDPTLREKELALRRWALHHKAILKDVLATSSSAEQRWIAADAVGYLNPSASQIKSLVSASRDSNFIVRNNAVRALGCIAASKKKKLARRIPTDEFIEMLNSGTWSDRNKAIFLIRKLSSVNPELPEAVRERALQALAEISCWDTGHASGARFLLGKVGDLSEERLNQLFAAADVDGIVKAARGPDAAKASADEKPTLPQLGVILRDAFLADQSDSERTKASDVYAKLLSERSVFEGTKLAGDYFNALSFESFHIGQQEAHNHQNDQAIATLNKSLLHAQEQEKACSEQNQDKQYANQWTNYVSATIAYLQGNSAQVEACKAKTGSNEKVVDRLLSGLKKYGSPDYARDY